MQKLYARGKDEKTYSRRHFVKMTTGGIAYIALAGLPITKGIAFADNWEEVLPSDNCNLRYVPENHLELSVNRIIPSGNCAQMILSTLCPEKLSSLAVAIDESERELYLNSKMDMLLNLPITGELYPRLGGDLRLSDFASIKAEVFVDAGYIQEDLDKRLALVEREGWTTSVFVDVSFGNLSKAYRVLGDFLECSSRAEILASFIDGLHSEIVKRKVSTEFSKSILFAGKEFGLSARNGDMVNEAISFMGGLPVRVPSDRNGMMNIRDIVLSDIDLVIFNNKECYQSILYGEGETYGMWSSVPAIQKGNYFVTPALFYNLLGSALLTQSLGLPWLCQRLWPEIYDFDLVAISEEFYELFFGYNLDDEQAAQLLTL